MAVRDWVVAATATAEVVTAAAVTEMVVVATGVVAGVGAV